MSRKIKEDKELRDVDNILEEIVFLDNESQRIMKSLADSLNEKEGQIELF